MNFRWSRKSKRRGSMTSRFGTFIFFRRIAIGSRWIWIGDLFTVNFSLKSAGRQQFKRQAANRLTAKWRLKTKKSMWLMTKHGFYSIVQKKPGEFHVRARVRQDLENLVDRVPLPGAEIHATKTADYSFRIVTGQGDVRKVMQFLGDSLDYSNFKDTIARTPDQQAKHDAYASVWHTMIDALGGYGRPPKQGR